MRFFLPITALLAAMAMMACAPAAEPGTAVQRAPASTTTQSKSSTPAPPTTTTPAALSKKQAAKAYLRIVKPYNVAMEALEKAINNGEPMSTTTQLAKATLKASKTEMRELRAIKWPAEVRAPVKKLVDAISTGLADWRRATRAQDRDTLIQAVIAATGHGADAAETIRKRLELSKYDEDDYS